MEKFLLKKSYQLKNFSKISYKSLWGTKGVFTTIRLYGEPANLILINEHIKNFNQSLKYFNINFKLSKKIILNLIKPYLKNQNYDHLLRISCNKKIISISLRRRKKPIDNFSIYLYRYQRSLANLKHLQYNKILNIQKKINLQKEEVVFYNKGSLLEGSTSNIIAVKENVLCVPPSGYYRGITLSYLLSKTNLKIIKKKIKKNDLQSFSEILLVGSGKEVISISSIKNIKWKRSSIKIYKKLINIYNQLLH
tara:strand:+ start:607 stop:1359 length:753 start_codon:yes stop_codon:yes gene_type:complete